MIADEETVRVELEWKERLYEMDEAALEDGEVVVDQIPSTYSRLAGYAKGRAICHALLDGEGEVRSWMRRAASLYIEKIDKTRELSDVVERYHQMTEPDECFDAFFVSIIANDDELIEEVTDRVETMTESPPSTYPRYEPEYRFSRALVFLLAGEEETAREEAEQATAYSEYPDRDVARKKCLLGLLDDEEYHVRHAIQRLLSLHHDERGQDASLATSFVSLDGIAFLRLARERGMEIDPEDFDDPLPEYLPAALIE